MEKLTKRERQVLIELMRNCRTSDQEIARKLKTSRPTVLKVRKRLEEKGVVKGYIPKVNFEKLDISVHSVVLYKWRDYSRVVELEKVIKFIKSLPEVILFIKGEGIGGKTDLIISVHKDLKEYETFIRKLKYEWKDHVESVEVFLSSVDGIFKGYDLASPISAILEGSTIYSA